MNIQKWSGELNERDKDRDVISDNQELMHLRSPEALRRNTAEIHEYLQARQAARSIVATTRTARGQYVDWIEAAAQTRDGQLADPPSEDGESNPYAEKIPDDYARWRHAP